MKNERKWNLTDDQMRALEDMNNTGCTDSDVYHYCMDNGVSLREADAFICDLNASAQCKGCKHVTMLSMGYPCNCCKRIHDKDMYEAR